MQPIQSPISLGKRSVSPGPTSDANKKPCLSLSSSSHASAERFSEETQNDQGTTQPSLFGAGQISQQNSESAASSFNGVGSITIAQQKKTILADKIKAYIKQNLSDCKELADELSKTDYLGTNVIWLLARHRTFGLIEELLQDERELITDEHLSSSPDSGPDEGKNVVWLLAESTKTKVNSLWPQEEVKNHSLIERLLNNNGKCLITEEHITQTPKRGSSQGKSILWFFMELEHSPVIAALLAHKVLNATHLEALGGPECESFYKETPLLWRMAFNDNFSLIHEFLKAGVLKPHHLEQSSQDIDNKGRCVLWEITYHLGSRDALFEDLLERGFIQSKSLSMAAQDGDFVGSTPLVNILKFDTDFFLFKKMINKNIITVELLNKVIYDKKYCDRPEPFHRPDAVWNGLSVGSWIIREYPLEIINLLLSKEVLKPNGYQLDALIARITQVAKQMYAIDDDKKDKYIPWYDLKKAEVFFCSLYLYERVTKTPFIDEALRGLGWGMLESAKRIMVEVEELSSIIDTRYRVSYSKTEGRIKKEDGMIKDLLLSTISYFSEVQGTPLFDSYLNLRRRELEQLQKNQIVSIMAEQMLKTKNYRKCEEVAKKIILDVLEGPELNLKNVVNIEEILNRLLNYLRTIDDVKKLQYQTILSDAFSINVAPVFGRLGRSYA